MPLYEYQCVKCGKKSEFIRSFSDPHETKCPRCGGVLKKLLSSPAVQFKGSGFYATDYGKSAGSKSEDSKGEKGEEEKKSSSKGEEGSGGSEAKGAEAGENKGDSSKGKKDRDQGAAPAAPSGPSSPAPSKKKKGDAK